MYLALLSQNTSANGKQAITQLIQHLSNNTDKRISELKLTYIASAPDATKQFFSPTAEFYKSVGINHIEYLEIEQPLSDVELAMLYQADIVHLSGGDTYRFLHWLKQQNLLPMLRELANSGTCLIGVSAGAMIMSPDIAQASLCGDENSIGLQDTCALGLIDKLFSPHASKSLDEQTQAKAFTKQLSHPVVLCSDDDAIVVTNDTVSYFGQPMVIG
ncbi:type 1 glutamine amidotransferase-like domain-containing protein [Shewanella sp. WXL01]|uniref:Type 1 glutamine amidotransferase-like domain-containing protein n=1 Tax=Shewanella sp. WXL01 TaxID=2709721 RepID=UPI001438509F|nr:Type 1 glutamine amidotransferase-like domain-containing protein [Shewanella sp. WXL01]NKF51124.1 type 1 glutamine amidotransferase-like domain-containing protein [Shewanella sp. WXL01]